MLLREVLLIRERVETNLEQAYIFRGEGPRQEGCSQDVKRWLRRRRRPGAAGSWGAACGR